MDLENIYEGNKAALFKSLGLAIGAAVIGLIFSGMDTKETAVKGLVLFVAFGFSLLFFGLFAGGVVDHFKIKAQLKKQNAEKAETEKKNEQIRQRMRSGEWKFPSTEFYKLCVQKEIKDINQSFYIQKAKLTAEEILRKYHVPEEAFHHYNNTEKLKEFYFQGKKVVEAKIQQQKKEEEAAQQKKQAAEAKRRSTPQTATPTTQEWICIRNAEKLAKTYGTEKRITMLLQMDSALQNKINALSKEIEKRLQEEKNRLRAAAAFGMTMTEATKKTTENAGFHAGLASGIGGPIAGAVVAADIMQKNAQIEKENQQTSAYYTQQSASMVNHILDDPTLKTADLEKERALLNRQLQDNSILRDKCKNKVVLEEETKETILPFVTASVTQITPLKNNLLEISLKIANTYVPNVPEGVSVVIDGTLTLDIYADKTLVGKAYAPLPLFGMPCKDSVEIKVLCDKYMVDHPKYTAKCHFNNLWVMEK